MWALGPPRESRTQPTDRQLLSRAERYKSAKLSSHFNVAIFQLRSLVANQIFYYIIFQFQAFPQLYSWVVYFSKSSETLFCLPSALMAWHIGQWLWDQNMCGPRTPSCHFLMAPERWWKHKLVNPAEPQPGLRQMASLALRVFIQHLPGDFITSYPQWVMWQFGLFQCGYAAQVRYQRYLMPHFITNLTWSGVSTIGPWIWIRWFVFPLSLPLQLLWIIV